MARKPPVAGIDLGLEVLVADATVVGQAHPAGRRRRAGRPFAREPGEAERRNFDHDAADAFVELAGLDRAALRNRAGQAAQFQGDAAIEAARIQDEIAGVARLTTGRQPAGQRRRRLVLRLYQLLHGRQSARFPIRSSSLARRSSNRFAVRPSSTEPPRPRFNAASDQAVSSRRRART